MTLPPILTSAELLALLNEGRAKKISRTALYQWASASPEWAACVVQRTARSTWWSVERLRQRGILP